jgi:hypothetical protein
MKLKEHYHDEIEKGMREALNHTLMSNEEKEHRIFQAVKYWADNNLSAQMCYLDESEFFRRCSHPELSDARCLYRMILKEVEAHNAKIRARRTLLENMLYKPKYLASSVLKGMRPPVKQLEILIIKNPDKNAYECYRLLMAETL